MDPHRQLPTRTTEPSVSMPSRPNIQVIGWREWASLPELGIEYVKAKIDTGARSSSLHAWDLGQFERGGATWVRFKVHPLQRNTKTTIDVEAPVLEFRTVKSSSGHSTLRPVIRTALVLFGLHRKIDLTLASRDHMGFRMLLGREALRKSFLVDPSRSYLAGRPAKRR
jgi:hypothetical protein